MAEPKGLLTEEQLEKASLNNPDGFGYAFVMHANTDKARVVVRKNRRYADLKDKFWKDYRRYRARSPFIVHFRYATHGEVSHRMAHPYVLRDGGAMIHNGIIDMPVTRKHDSDTLMFVNKVVNQLPDNWQYTNTWVEMVARMMESGNKLVFLWPSATTLVLGEKNGHWKDHVWFSNYTYNFAPSKGVTRRFPAVWQTHASDCVCELCFDYDAEHPEDIAKYTAWVRASQEAKAVRLGGKGSAWVAANDASSVSPITLTATGNGGVLPAGRYVVDGGSIYPVPAPLVTKTAEEVFEWFEKNKKSGQTIKRISGA